MNSMLSRVADALYWMSRYLERAEHAARVAEVHLNLALEQSSKDNHRWMRAMDGLGIYSPPKIHDESEFTRWLLYDSTHRQSIVSCIIGARENSRQVREQISSEMWEQLNRLFHEVKKIQQGGTTDPLDFLREVREGSHLFQGLTDSTMNHGEGWQFIQLGRFIERAASLANLLNMHYREFRQTVLEPEDHLEWIGLLKCCTAFEAYCKVYSIDLQPQRILNFLLLHAEFPHSVRFSVESIEAAMKLLPPSAGRKGMAKPMRLAGKLSAALSYTPIEEIIHSGLNAYLEDFHKQCGEIHKSIHQVYVEYPIEAAIEA